MFQTFKPVTTSLPSERTQNNSIGKSISDTENNTVASSNNTYDDDDVGDYEEEMSVWSEKVINISKNDPNWMDMTGDAVIATIFAARFLVQSLTRESSLIASYRQRPLSFQDDTSLEQEGKENQLILQLNYNDIADCISIKDQFTFLSDMIPRTKNLKELVLENKTRYTTFIINPDEANHPSNTITQIDLNNNDNTEDEDNNNNNNNRQQQQQGEIIDM